MRMIIHVAVNRLRPDQKSVSVFQIPTGKFTPRDARKFAIEVVEFYMSSIYVYIYIYLYMFLIQTHFEIESNHAHLKIPVVL